MTAQLFRAHGKFCASHPWEVIVALLTLTACMLTVDRSKSPVPASRLRNCQGWRESCEGLEAEYVAVDTILMTVIRCSAVLYSYYQFIYLNKFGSKYILSKCRLWIVHINTSSIISSMHMCVKWFTANVCGGWETAARAANQFHFLARFRKLNLFDLRPSSYVDSSSYVAMTSG